MALQQEGCQLGLPIPETMYTTVPDGLIEVPEASKKYDIPLQTLHTWLRRGHLRPIGRKRDRGPGGGHIVVSEADLIQCRDTPKSKGGRPPKSEA